MPRYRNPLPTVDLVIETADSSGRRGVVLIKRKNPPFGWALPGGFVEYGESCEDAARREAAEETSLKVKLTGQLGTYSDPRRDPRKHTISTVFTASARGRLKAGDDAREARVFSPREIPSPLAFDHAEILADYFRLTRVKLGARRGAPQGGCHGRKKAR